MAEAFNVCPHFPMELHVSLVCGIPYAPWLEYIPQLDSLTRADMARMAQHPLSDSMCERAR